VTQVSRNAPCPCGSGKKYKACCLAKDEAARKPHTGEDAVIVCMPSRGQICYETQLALECNMDGIPYCVARVGRMDVIAARNNLAEMALETASTKNPFKFTPREWFVLWVDDDAWWYPGTVKTMLDALHHLPKLDALFGSFCIREPYQKTLAFRDAHDLESFPKRGVDCKDGEIVPIERCGFHFVLMRLSLLKRIGPKPFTPPPDSDCGEDSAFCERAVSIGASLGVGISMPIVHIDPRDGTAYLPGMPAMLMSGNSVKSLGSPHLSGHGSVKSAELRRYGSGIDERVAKHDAEGEKIKKELEATIERRRRISDGAA
jgi:hypothetical protein